jgi:two-component SAPR family response regulator
MTEKQEAEWLYAKGLELAILLKGPVKKNITDDSVIKLIEEEYDAIAGRIAGKILDSAKTMVIKNLI